MRVALVAGNVTGAEAGVSICTMVPESATCPFKLNASPGAKLSAFPATEVTSSTMLPPCAFVSMIRSPGCTATLPVETVVGAQPTVVSSNVTDVVVTTPAHGGMFPVLLMGAIVDQDRVLSA